MPVGLQPATQPHLLETDVRLQELQLLAQRNEIGAAVAENRTQQRSQRSQHPVRARRIALDECIDSLKCIEEKVWMQLRPQSCSSLWGCAQLDALDFLAPPAR